MDMEKAKYIIAEIKSIKRYEKIITNLDEKLQDIAAQIETIQSPSCSLGNTGTHSESPTNKVTRINELLSEEMKYIEEQEEFKKLKRKAEVFRTLVYASATESDLPFLKDFFDGKPYGFLSRKYYISNIYKKAVVIVTKAKV